VFSVVEETIQFLVEFKFLEESFTGRTCKVVNPRYVYVKYEIKDKMRSSH